MENGESEPRGDTLKRIANALEIPTHPKSYEIIWNKEKNHYYHHTKIPFYC
ncbi:MAG: helix-turn-helix transcriptional regulator [Bacteroidota bacterium]